MSLLGKIVESKEITCPYCGTKIREKGVASGDSKTLTCSSCDKRLPREIFQCDKYIKISVVGLTGCGKTTLMTVMLKEFEQKLYDKLYIETMNDYDNPNTLREEYIESLYKKKEALKSTASGAGAAAAAPQFYRIMDMLRYSRIRNSAPVYSLTILDGAGEDYKQMEEVATRNISISDYIFYLVDPKGLPKVNAMLGGGAVANEYAGQQMVTNMAQYLRCALGVTGNKKIEKPVAVILTKFDLIKEHMPGMLQGIVGQEKPFEFSGTYIKSDIDAVNKEIRSWLAESKVGENYFLAALDANFSNIRFFGVSSLGGEEKADGKIEALNPHRVLDPLIWVLSKEKIVTRVEI